MIDAQTPVAGRPLLGLVLSSLAVMGSPGPSTLSLVAVAGRYRVRSALSYCLGLIAGTTAVLIAVATGVTVLLLAVPALRWVMLALSAAYIVWLAVRLATAPGLSGHAPGGREPSLFGGVLLGALNPKAWVAIGAVFASARVSDLAAVDGAVKVVVLTGMIILIHLSWLLAGRLLERALRTPRKARAFNITLAALLIAGMLPALL